MRRIWLLNKQSNAKNFEAKVIDKWTGCSDNVEDTRLLYKKCMLEAADEVCGCMKGKVRILPGIRMKVYEDYCRGQ